MYFVLRIPPGPVSFANLAYKSNVSDTQFYNTGKNNGFPFLDILGCLKNTHKNPKFGKVRQVPTREFPTKFPELTYLSILTYLHWLILAGYVPLASQNPYPIIGYSVANYRPHHSHLAFGQM